MSNVQAPFGFQQTSTLTGASPNYAVVHRQISSGNTNKIGRGDPVIELSNGYIDIALSTSNPILGIFDGLEYYDTSQQKTLWQPSWQGQTTGLSGSILAAVVVDPQGTYRIQAGGSSTTGVTLANIGNNATFGGQGAPATGSGISVAYLDVTTISTTNTLPLRIVGLSGAPNNDTTSAYDTVIVKLNTQTYSQTTGV
jgi:hypothetical protein